MNITVCGFYGWGNVGDEAIIKSIMSRVNRTFRSISWKISTQVPHVYFNRIVKHYGPVTLVTQYNIGIFDDCNLFLLGGGQLGVGNGWYQCLHAKRKGAFCAYFAVGIGEEYLDEAYRSTVKEFLNIFDLITVRDIRSKEILNKLGISCFVTGDPSLNLENEKITWELARPQLAVCTRRVPDAEMDRQVRLVSHALRQVMAKTGAEVLLLPPTPHDIDGKKEDLLVAELVKSSLNEFKDQIRIRVHSGYRPGRLKAAIAKSDMLLSAGRLHPLIFAASEGIPMVAIAYPKASKYHKIRVFMEELGQEDSCLDYATTTPKAIAEKVIKTWDNRKEWVIEVKTAGRRLKERETKNIKMLKQCLLG